MIAFHRKKYKENVCVVRRIIMSTKICNMGFRLILVNHLVRYRSNSHLHQSAIAYIKVVCVLEMMLMMIEPNFGYKVNGFVCVFT